MLGAQGESIITVVGEVDLVRATEICSRLMFDDALGFESITLLINARSSDVFVASSLIDTLSLCGAKTRAVVSGAAGGTLVAVLGGCDSSAIFPHGHLDFRVRPTKSAVAGGPPFELVTRETHRMVEAIAAASSLDVAFVQDLFDRGAKLYGPHAKDLGLVDGIESKNQVHGTLLGLGDDRTSRPTGFLGR